MKHVFHAILLIAAVVAAVGCRSDEAQLPSDPRTAEADRQVRAKWGKGLDELPTVTLVAITANNVNIREEFEWAFSLHHALEYGQKVRIDWRDVSGGGGTIENYIFNTYSGGDSAGIDVVWGGGEFMFINFCRPTDRHPGGLLEPLTLGKDVLAQVPPDLGGQIMRDKGLRWVGSAISGFGFLYNAEMLQKIGLPLPAKWADLTRPQYADMLTLADPGQSSSAAAAYRMIVICEESWQVGWERLLGVLANTKRFADSAGTAANTPVLGDALIATCIDFYGIMRAAEAPDKLVYVSPAGETTFTCDPIGILKNPPNPELARRFVDFVMSVKGQTLWALPPGQPGGAVRSVLGRQPIRRDVYDLYAGQMTPRTVNPYQAGQLLQPSKEMAGLNFSVLRLLISTAAVDNLQPLRRARDRLNQLRDTDPRAYEAKLAEFNRLPSDADTIAKVNDAAKKMKDPRQLEELRDRWREFFRAKYEKIAG